MGNKQYIKQSEAESQGFQPLTYPIDPVLEMWIIDNVIEDMEKGKIPYVLVEQERGVEVWRKSRFTT